MNVYILLYITIYQLLLEFFFLLSKSNLVYWISENFPNLEFKYIIFSFSGTEYIETDRIKYVDSWHILVYSQEYYIENVFTQDRRPMK